MRLGLVVSFLLLFSVSACSTSGERLASDSGINAGKTGEIYDTRTGTQVSEAELISSLRQAGLCVAGREAR